MSTSPLSAHISRLAVLLQGSEHTLSVAESCTGGGMGFALTDMPGASEWFAGGCITYSNDAKVSLLGVDEQTLQTHGAVSEEVAVEMAFGATRATGATIGVSMTGVAGPGGGSDKKPVGTVCFGVVIGESAYTCTQHFEGDRAAVRASSIHFAIAWVIERLESVTD